MDIELSLKLLNQFLGKAFEASEHIAAHTEKLDIQEFIKLFKAFNTTKKSIKSLQSIVDFNGIGFEELRSTIHSLFGIAYEWKHDGYNLAYEIATITKEHLIISVYEEHLSNEVSIILDNRQRRDSRIPSHANSYSLEKAIKKIIDELGGL